MPIDNPQAIAFTNNVIRPLAAKVRSLHLEIDAAMVSWFNGMNVLIPNGDQIIEDGREAEGISRLSGTDAVNLIVAIQAVQTALSDRRAIVDKPCVDPIEVK